VKERLLIGEVPIERPDPNVCALCDRIPCRLATNLKNQGDGRLYQSLTISLSVGPHLPPLSKNAEILTLE
jgi:hypothetical protein